MQAIETVFRSCKKQSTVPRIKTDQQHQYETNPLQKMGMITGWNLKLKKWDSNTLDALGSLKWNILNVMFVYVSHQHLFIVESSTFIICKFCLLQSWKSLFIYYYGEFLHGLLSLRKRFWSDLCGLIFASLRLPKKIFEFNFYEL